ncbi:IclR family transcriptional regulator [Paenibacillus rhizosphaerae]|uniref:Glycerol operon regulatory protein n=1 Tax=Paenibacillus rhizosphaerae TaxID=297318 RepID=A0A1R1EC61_9BACL|nr:IclR family transcriptional regulator [Paenibacillus rhizosphaerae]OMF49397.1 IclR family transcriptional regulator [Paenibacillus rhizosphaerae]
MTEEVKVKTLKKALDVLGCFSASVTELGISEISEKLGLYKSNVHNLVSTFEQFGYMEKNPDNGKYRLGMKVLELAYIINSNLGLHNLIYPPMRALSTEINEVVYFALPKEPLIIYLEGVYPSSSYSSRSMVGETAEMYCTSLGKAILANLPPDRAVKAIAGQSMAVYTPNTITEKDILLDELELTRKRGYSIDNMEHEFGIKCVGVPVFKRDGSLLGAMSISGPSLRLDDQTVKEYAEKLRTSSQKISLRI